MNQCVLRRNRNIFFWHEIRLPEFGPQSDNSESILMLRNIYLNKHSQLSIRYVFQFSMLYSFIDLLKCVYVLIYCEFSQWVY
jgi:hypothetical protein